MKISHSDFAYIGTELALSIIDTDLLKSLARNCPGLETFDWKNYLECSRCRIEKVLEFMEAYQEDLCYRPILDCGSWLGNFSLALHHESWSVVSCEMWARYSPALDLQKQLLAANNIDVMDMSMLTGRPQGPHYSAALLMSTIEHIPDSPRRLLKILYDALLPGGFLILDTPNLAFVANRDKLNRGYSPYVAIEQQFFTEAPFEGHVREYTADELKWMLEKTGFEVVETDFFNYSGVRFWQSPIAQTEMLLDPTKRELIFMAARKPL